VVKGILVFQIINSYLFVSYDEHLGTVTLLSSNHIVKSWNLPTLGIRTFIVVVWESSTIILIVSVNESFTLVVKVSKTGKGTFSYYIIRYVSNYVF